MYIKKVSTLCFSFPQTKSYQNDQINKQTDQMFVLLAICLVLHPQRIDESIHTTLRFTGGHCTQQCCGSKDIEFGSGSFFKQTIRE